MSYLSPDTPCVGICSTMIGDDICRGCGRTDYEVVNWNFMTEEEKEAIRQRIKRRRDIAIDPVVGDVDGSIFD